MTNRAGPTRRSALGAIGTAAALMPFSTATYSASARYTFSHGVASGDPTQTAIILWTRVIDTNDAAVNIMGSWQVSEQKDFSSIAAQGSFETGPKRDFTVKVDAQGLEAGKQYFYRFRTGQVTSPIGRTRTLPAAKSTAPIQLAVVSCSNYSHGFFHVYNEIAKRPYHAVLHLGDYIYEYAEGKYDNPKVLQQGRSPKPKLETISLDDYRQRYAQYRTDPDLQAVHAAHPFICVWDDHEIANDSWHSGAENHNDDEGPYADRQKAALQAYMEWLPIRETAATDSGKIYRSFELGGLASLIMLDTRHIGRDEPLDYARHLPMRTIPFDFSNPDQPLALLSADAAAEIPKEAIKHITVPFDLRGERPAPVTDWQTIKGLDPKNLPKGFSYLPDIDRFKTEILGAQARTIMGQEQEIWFEQQLSASKQAGHVWQIVGQQLLIGKLGIPAIADESIDYTKGQYFTREQMGFFRMLGEFGLPLNLDAWDGYPACRDRIFQAIAETGTNAVFLAGDTHNAWAFELTDQNGKPVGIELATASVSSPGLEAYIPAEPDVVRDSLLDASPELQFADTKNRGWMELDISATAIDTTWHSVSTVVDTSYEVNSLSQAHLPANSNKLSVS